MKRLLNALAPVGLVVIAGATWAFKTGRALPGSLEVYLIAGAALVLGHLLLRWEDLLAAVGARQLRYGGNALLLTAVVLGILVAVNWLAYRNPKRWDLTKGQRHSLSPQTKKVLAGLTEDVTLTYFHRTSEMRGGADRVREYQTASPHVKAEFVDPVKEPAKAKQHEISVVPTIVVEYRGKREKISNESEQDVTNAVIKVTREKQKTICFAEGEGERDFDDTTEKGYSSVKSAIEKAQYATKKVGLFGAREVPAECTVLVVAGPRKDLAPRSLDLVRAYVRAGGKALVLVEPGLEEKTPNLDGLLREWNIEAGQNVVVDLYGELARISALASIGKRYPYHEITKDFAFASVFFVSRTVEAGKESPEGVFAQNLVETNPDAEDINGTALTWAETDIDLRKLQTPRFDRDKDRLGPLPLGAVATVRPPEPSPSPSPSPGAGPSPSPETKDEPSRPEGRVVVLGDSDFASNGFLGLPGTGNLDLFMNAVAWLGQDVELITIRPPEPDDHRMTLTREQVINVLLVSFLVLPGAFVVLGVTTWWRRR